jgi:uncharacterized RDD family membrane protein YckC
MPPQPPETPFDSVAPFDKHTIETPEQLLLDFPIAGVGSRFLAIAIDTLIQTVVAIVVVLVAVLIFSVVVSASAKNIRIWLMAILGVLLFAIYYGYFAVFEILWNGQTPGKRKIGLRVMKDSGRPLTAAESIGRNLFRIVDQLPAFYALGMVVAFLNVRNKRLGDLIAGSVVVRETSQSAAKPVWQMQQASATAFSGAFGSALSSEHLAIIDAFLNRRSDLDVDVRSRTAWQILKRVRPDLVDYAAQGVGVETVLEALARERHGA